MTRHARVLGVALLAALACAGPAMENATATWVAEVETQREQREERLRAEDGWLTLVGLSWLEPGENRFGTDPSNPIVFPQGTAPALAGSLIYDGTVVRLEAAPEAGITLDGEAVSAVDLHDDHGQQPDVLRLGRLRFHVIHRDGRHALRVKDAQNAARLDFGGLEYFPIDPAYRVRARFEPFDEAREVPIQTMIGTPTTMLAPGRIEFELGGANHALLPLVSDIDQRELFIIFRDATSGHETYGAGRYLYATLEEDDGLWLDFNLAYNPPCVFSSYATCPLPPRGNRLELRVEAGEKVYGEDH